MVNTSIIQEKQLENLEEFILALLKIMQSMTEALDQKWSFERSISMKTNDNQGLAITCRQDGSDVCPSIPVSQLYEEYTHGKDMEDIAEEVMHIATRSDGLSQDGRDMISKITDPAYVKDHLHCQLVNVDMNKELLAKCPHQLVTDDLAVIARITLSEPSDESGIASAVVNQQILEQLRMTKEELLGAARTNLEKDGYELQGLGTMLMGLLPEVDMEYRDEIIGGADDCAYVLTVPSRYDGAAVLASPSIMNEVGQQVGEDFWVLPSSRHELLLVPQSKADDVRTLRDMVVSVNREQVAGQDFLADNVYHYDCQTHKIEMCFDRDGQQIIRDHHQEREMEEHISRGRAL